MKHLLGWVGLAAAFHALPALAQPAHSQHHGEPKAADSRTAAPPAARKPPRAAPAGARRHASAFDDYRHFRADEPMKDWKAANDEVREAGGHVGILKSATRGERR